MQLPNINSWTLTTNIIKWQSKL